MPPELSTAPSNSTTELHDDALLRSGSLCLTRRLQAPGRSRPAGHTLGLTIATQCSLERLPALERLVGAWEGAVVVAILLEQRDGSHSANSSSSLVRLVGEMHERTGRRFEALLFSRSVADTARPYPINALRNAALQAAAHFGPLVWILDVDCVPVAGTLASLVGTAERAAALQRLCCDEGAAVVVPCLEIEHPPASVADAKVRRGIASRAMRF